MVDISKLQQYERNFVYIMCGVFYASVFFDLMSIIHMGGKNLLQAAFGWTLFFFLTERAITIAYRLVKFREENYPAKQIVIEVFLTLFFVDMALATKLQAKEESRIFREVIMELERRDPIKRKKAKKIRRQQIKNGLLVAEYDPNKEEKEKNDIEKESWQKKSTTFTGPTELFIIRSYAFGIFSMFIVMYESFLDYEFTVYQFFSIFTAWIQFALATCRIYHFQTRSPPYQETVAIFLVVLYECGAKVVLWGFFCWYLEGGALPFVWLFLAFAIGFCVELFMQIKGKKKREEQAKFDEEQKQIQRDEQLKQMEIDQKKKEGPILTIKQLKKKQQELIDEEDESGVDEKYKFVNPFLKMDHKNFGLFNKFIFFPFLVGYQCAFYSRYEDVMVTEVDPEEKAMQKGKFPCYFRLVELTIFMIFMFLTLSKYNSNEIFLFFGFLFYVLHVVFVLPYFYTVYVQKKPFKYSFRKKYGWIIGRLMTNLHIYKRFEPLKVIKEEEEDELKDFDEEEDSEDDKNDRRRRNNAYDNINFDLNKKGAGALDASNANLVNNWDQNTDESEEDKKRRQRLEEEERERIRLEQLALQEAMQREKEEQERLRAEREAQAKLDAEQAEKDRLLAEQDAEEARKKREAYEEEMKRLAAERQLEEEERLREEMRKQEELEREREAERMRLQKEEEERQRLAEEERLRMQLEEEERHRQAEEERLRIQQLQDEEEKKKAEEALRLKLLAEEEAARKAEEERLKRIAEEEEAVRKAEEERLKRIAEEEEAARVLEEQRLREQEEARKAEEERLRKLQEEEEAARKAEEERLLLLAEQEAERLRKQAEEEERLRKAEEERLRKLAEEEARLRAAEEERLLKEEEDRLRLEAEAERKRKEEEERQRILEEERLAREEAERLQKEAEEAEKERLRLEEEERQRKAEEERLRLEAEEKERQRIAALAEAERLEQERLEKERLEKERIEAERLEAERLEKERIEKERLEKERQEKLAAKKARMMIRQQTMAANDAKKEELRAAKAKLQAEKDALDNENENLVKDAQFMGKEQEEKEAEIKRMKEREQQLIGIKKGILEREKVILDARKELQEKLDGLDYGAAREKINNIKVEDILFIQSLKNPPERIKVCLEAVISVLKSSVKKQKWDDTKKEILNPNFRRSIIIYDPMSMPPKVLKYVQKEYIQNAVWDLKKMTKAAAACGILAEWVDSLIKFNVLMSKNKPLFEKAQKLEKEQRAMQDDIDKVSELEEEEQQYRNKQVKLREEQGEINQKQKTFIKQATMVQGRSKDKQAEIDALKTANLELIQIDEDESDSDLSDI